MYYYNATLGECRQFQGGEDIFHETNGNRFYTCEECQIVCRFTAPCNNEKLDPAATGTPHSKLVRLYLDDPASKDEFSEPEMPLNAPSAPSTPEPEKSPGFGNWFLQEMAAIRKWFPFGSHEQESAPHAPAMPGKSSRSSSSFCVDHSHL